MTAIEEINQFMGWSRVLRDISSLGSLVVNGVRGSWPKLETLTVKNLFGMSICNRDSDIAFGLSGTRHLMADLRTVADSYIKLALSTIDGLCSSPKTIDTHRKAILQSMSVLDDVEGALKEINSYFSEVYNTSLLEILLNKPLWAFHREYLCDTPESIERALISNSREGVLKKKLFRGPHGDFHLSVFRMRILGEDSNDRVYDVDAFVHDASDKVVAKVSIVLFNSLYDPNFYGDGAIARPTCRVRLRE